MFDDLLGKKEEEKPSLKELVDEKFKNAKPKKLTIEDIQKILGKNYHRITCNR
jgi:chromosomal replication initiation ATPase DnaA